MIDDTPIAPCTDDGDPTPVTGDPVDETEVLGDAAPLADPAAHQGGED